MTGAADPIRADEPLDDTAAAWLVRRHQGMSRREEDAFLTWLTADPSHKLAYDRLAHGWAALDTMAAAPQMSGLISDALAANPRPRSRAPQWAAIAATLLIAALIGFGLNNRASSDPETAQIAVAPREIRTVPGERSTMVLSDGSTITLNTDTRVRVLYGQRERRITLLAGQVYFQVAHDATRPFVVSAADREIVAVGTEFEVRVDRDDVAVALAEGKVKVHPRMDLKLAPRAPSPVILRPGELLVFKSSEPVSSIKAANIADLTRWREGQVRFDAAPLSEAIAEMNRYGSKRIVIMDPGLKSIQVSGIFQTGQSANFVTALTELFPVHAEDADTEIRLRRRDGP